ncbi:hypothetical protein YC2023_042304 [Brassica napus]
MKYFHSFLLLLIIAYGIFESVQAQDQSEFISLACGLVPKETVYTEKSTNIIYESDANYIDSGLVGRINDANKTRLQQQYWTLRSFPEGERNCYNFNLTANRKYLIKASFNYGNYDDLNRLPRFDLHIGPNKWTSVSFPGGRYGSNREMIHVLTQNRLQVCLVKTGETTPFINSLEIRPLHNGTYVTQSGSLILVSREIIIPNCTITVIQPGIYNYVTVVQLSCSCTIIKYDDDIHDRTWLPYSDDQKVSIRTDLFVNTSNFYDVPEVVAKTAAVPKNASQPLTLNWTLSEITAQTYIYMHFAEIHNLEANDIREFNITYNGGKNWFPYYRPRKLQMRTLYNPRALNSPDGKFNFSFVMTGNSTLPPLINALEIYNVLNFLQLDTSQDEVSAMVNIKQSYELKEKVSWQGDPCAPQFLHWEGLKCSYPNADSPMIISLNLTDSKLTGRITPEFAKLTQLIELDLSKNDLSGDIPAFFADMKLLKLILSFLLCRNLSGNPNLNSTIPDSLQQSLSETHRKESKKVPVVAIAMSVAGVFALLVILAIIFVVRRRIKKARGPISVNASGVKSKDLKITYHEVLKITKNFERVLGKGGFGTVYYGNLDDTQVAVKMLSHSSAQGYKEFKAEVDLLSRVHHRYLVGLVGYCDDGDNLALIYEYMANGDLSENMSGKRGGNVLTWEKRMQIAVEAAQGLEYLHNGCQPPMVHRDVKTTNILLNERYGAKLADFGLTRSFPIDGDCQVSTAVAGTPGYLDPE